MGLFKRYREWTDFHREIDEVMAATEPERVARGEVIESSIEAAKNCRRMFLRDGEIDFRALVTDYFKGAPIIEIEFVKDHYRLNNLEIETLYDSQFWPQWEGLSKEERHANLVELIRYDNWFAANPTEDFEDDELAYRTDLAISINKITTFCVALAFDAEYEQYVDSMQIAWINSPEQFGSIEDEDE